MNRNEQVLDAVDAARQLIDKVASATIAVTTPAQKERFRLLLETAAELQISLKDAAADEIRINAHGKPSEPK